MAHLKVFGHNVGEFRSISICSAGRQILFNTIGMNNNKNFFAYLMPANDKGIRIECKGELEVVENNGDVVLYRDTKCVNCNLLTFAGSIWDEDYKGKRIPAVHGTICHGNKKLEQRGKKQTRYGIISIEGTLDNLEVSIACDNEVVIYGKVFGYIGCSKELQVKGNIKRIQHAKSIVQVVK